MHVKLYVYTCERLLRAATKTLRVTAPERSGSAPKAAEQRDSCVTGYALEVL